MPDTPDIPDHAVGKPASASPQFAQRGLPTYRSNAQTANPATTRDPLKPDLSMMMLQAQQGRM